MSASSRRVLPVVRWLQVGAAAAGLGLAVAAAPGVAWADDGAPSSASDTATRGAAPAHRGSVRNDAATANAGNGSPATETSGRSGAGVARVSAQTTVIRADSGSDIGEAIAPQALPAATVHTPSAATVSVPPTSPAASAVSASVAAPAQPNATAPKVPSSAPRLGAFRSALRLNVEDLFSGGAPKVTNPTAVVNGLFEEVLRRDPTADELKNYVRDLNLFGVNAVIAGLYNSNAFRQNAVNNYYLKLLDRTPTQQELTLGTIEYARESALGSPESYAASLNLAGGRQFYDYSGSGGGTFGTQPSATTYVDLLYRSFLGQKADPVAAPELIQRIERGLPTLLAANEFVRSDAYRTVTVGNIYQVLGQQGSPADIAGYVKNWILKGGQPGISQSLLSTTANIDLIQAGLYSPPDVASAEVLQQLLLAPYVDGPTGFNERYKALIGDCSDTSSPNCLNPVAYELIKSGGTKRGIPNGSSSNNALDANVATLVPTQNEINLDQSLKFPLVDPGTLETYFKGGVITPFSGPIVTANNGTYIVDGHHRWSAIYLINPNTQVIAQDLGYVPTPKTALRQSQFGIVATTGVLKESQAGTPNVYDVSRPEFDKYVADTINSGQQKDQVIATFGKYISTPETWATLTDPQKVTAIQDYLWKNVLLMRDKNPYIPGATSRVVMPQYTKDPNLVLDNLTGGSVSFSFPTISYLG